MDDTEKHDVLAAFAEAVNMAPAKLETWLETEHSQEVGWPKDRGDAESVGHQSGRRIVDIKRKHADELTDDDYAHMRKVISYVARHSAQRPEGDITSTPWRYSLMNWGHDPLIDERESA
jgi:hypothetical protein